MPAHARPSVAGPDEGRSVELQDRDRRPPYGCQAEDSRRSLDPPEVLLPALVARVVEADRPAADRIDRRRPVTLVTVALRACQPEIIFFGETTEGLGNVVLDLHRYAGDLFTECARRIRDRLFARDEWQGVTGTIRFDATWNNIAPVVLRRVHDGRFVTE